MADKQSLKKKLQYEAEKDRQKVKGKFVFHECPGGVLKFTAKLNKGDKIERFALRDGHVYELPLGIAKHLNNNCWYPEHKLLIDEDGNPSHRVNKRVQRFSFQSLEFIDIEELSRQADIDVVTPL